MPKTLYSLHVVYATVSLLATAVLLGMAVNGDPKTLRAPSLGGATAWLNTDPLTLQRLRGKVVLIDFWTFTCINWRRTLPYVRAWNEKYRDQGLVVIGVHTPEFSFEHQRHNVQRAVQSMKIDFAVAMDNEMEIWNSFDNNYWPAVYLIDAKGKLRYQKFGEGAYQEIEMQIQKLLRQGPGKDVATGFATPQVDGYEVAADWESLRSPENFLGYSRSEGFASTRALVPDQVMDYKAPAQLKLNQWRCRDNGWPARKIYAQPMVRRS